MTDVTYKLEGMKEFADLLSKLPMEMEKKAVNTAVRSASFILKKAVKENAPVYKGRGHPSRTTSRRANKGSNVTIFPGVLKRSIRVVVNKKEKLSNFVGVGRAFYAMFLEWGTKPHIIEPKGLGFKGAPQVLADYTTRRFFGKKVKHPGIRKRSFLTGALHKSHKPIVSAFGESLAGSINREADKWLNKYKVKRSK